MKHVDFKPKIRIPESKRQISVTIKRKKKRAWKKRRKPSCIDCIDGKLVKTEEGFRGKTNVHCYTWNLIVHPHQARICPRFCPRSGGDGRKRRV